MKHGIRTAVAAAGALLAAQAWYAPAAGAAESVEARVQRLEDEATIRLKLDEYMDLLGARDWDNYIKMWSKDADLVMAEGVRHGRDDIKERMSSTSARQVAAAASRPARQRAEVLSNIRVQVHGDTANARSRFMFVGEGEDGMFRVTGSGWYTDTWIREEGEWRIKRRAVNWDLLTGQSAEDAAKNAAAAKRY
jgi:3-phenylpropionate/cinnamic acid dioxygenase small subunit